MAIEILQLNKGEMVAITWSDSYGVISEWVDKEDPPEINVASCVTLGFVELATVHRLILFMTDSQNQVLGRMVIPTCSITKIQRLKIAS